jgi:glycosyltransferase involved in cell wall biosynthesis
MRILLLSQYYTPEPDIKVHLLARSLVARGHQVTTITGFPNYPHGQIYPGYHQRLWQREIKDGVQVIRLPLYPDHSRSVIRRTLNYLSFAASASILGPILCGPADVMWVYHPPLTIGFPAWLIGLLRRIPFIYEVQDMWPETLTATGMLLSPRVVGIVGALARTLYSRAAAITVISTGFQHNLIDKGVPAEKIHVIPNWADEELYQPTSPAESLAVEYGMAGRFNIVYGGNLGAAQAMENVLAAAALLRDLPQIQFVLIGDGLDEPALRRQAAEQQLDNVRFIGRQPAERMPHFFALADLLLVHLKRDPLFEITIPSKTLAYLACGRPIVAAVAGDAADVVRDAGAGMVCPPEDPVALARAVRALVALPPAERERMGQAGRQAFLAHFTRAVLVDRYEEIFREVVRHSTHQPSSASEWQAS